MRFAVFYSSFALALLDLVSAQTNSSNSSLPVVDLGYELHQAALFNATGRFYTFSNIRYAAPPVLDLRFRPPQAPATTRSVIQTGGNASVICPQSYPSWILEGQAFTTNYSQGLPFNASAYQGPNITNLIGAAIFNNSRISEDCLFLDVLVPEKVFKSAGKGAGAPVLVWIHGGGYDIGSKVDSGYPSGLIERSMRVSSEGVLFVPINYRLGAFGWSAGSTVQSDGTSNAGLYDQRFALEWVQQHISEFGGDPKQVTVFGESAGAGSIVYQITAYGGSNGSAPFKRAIAQSPAFRPVPKIAQQEATFQGFLSFLNVSSLAEARKLPASALINANLYQTATQAKYGDFLYGPVVDGSFVPQLPGLLFLEGKYAKDVQVMVSQVADEGALFTDPATTNETYFIASIRAKFPTASNATIQYITQTLYPPIYDGSQPYSNVLERAVLLDGEVFITCNEFFLDTAYQNRTYSSLFSVPPGIHGTDIGYDFYTGEGTTYASVINATVAEAQQEFIESFATNGRPTTDIPGVPAFPIYGAGATVLNITATSFSEAHDPAANARCQYWQKAPYI